MCPRSSERPSPPASSSTPPTCSEPQRYTHGDATRPLPGGRSRPAHRSAPEKYGACVRRRPVPAWQHSGAPAPYAPHRPCSRAAPGAGQLRRAAGRVGGGGGRQPTGAPPPGRRGRVPVGRSSAPPHWAPHVYGNPPPGASPPGVR